MALSDEINSCNVPEGYPSGTRISGRPKIFCDSVTVQGPLVASGGTTTESLIATSPIVIDGITFAPVEIIGTNGTFLVLGVMTAGAPAPPGAGA